MSIILFMSNYCKQWGVTIEDIIDPKSDVACTVRDNLISRLGHEKGLQAGEIKNFLNLPIHYIKEKLRP